VSDSAHGTRGGPRRHRPGDAASYGLGEWTVFEALRHRPDTVRAVLLDPALAGERRDRLIRAAEAAGVAWRDDPRALRALRHRSDARALVLVDASTDQLEPTADHVALIGTRNAGNLGAVLRTSLGFDLRDVALIGAGLDPWSPHVLRASLGARFALRVATFADLQSYRAAHPDRATATFAAPGPGRASVPLSEARVPHPVTLAFGPEWPGRASDPRAPEAAGDLLVHIPQHADLESHNLAVAVGIALYALRHRAC
jgi:RNA methyltransferase, TrmH family